jgi:hypothetical protein
VAITSRPSDNSVRCVEIKPAIRDGGGRDGRALQPPMLWYARMNDADLSALVAWLPRCPPLQ